MGSMLINNIGRLVTMKAGPGREGPLGVMERAAVRIQGGLIAWVGRQRDLPPAKGAEEVIDAADGVILPGLIDCHTHIIHAGSRQQEFKLRSEGKSYQEIAAAGGGIMSTVRATRAATADELYLAATRRADEMLGRGVTTAEIKTGYGLEPEAEMKMVEVIRRLARNHPIGTFGTFLGAHVVPVEYQARREEYVRLVIDRMLPQAAASEVISGCDIFVEEIAFSPDEAREIARAAQALGLGLHLHVDQFGDGGGGQLAAGLGAQSASHMDYTSEKGVVAGVLPGASFFTGGGHYPDVRKMIDTGLAVAISTDYNPGTSPSLDLMLDASIAVTQMGMTCDEALAGITKHAAAALGLSDRGTLSQGKRADVVIFDAPDEYYPLYRYGDNFVSQVILGGRIL
jgi:imidazolonepropionase